MILVHMDKVDFIERSYYHRVYNIKKPKLGFPGKDVEKAGIPFAGLRLVMCGSVCRADLLPGTSFERSLTQSVTHLSAVKLIAIGRGSGNVYYTFTCLHPTQNPRWEHCQNG